MKSMHTTILKISLVLLVAPAANADDGWVSMFNGKSLAGWTQKNGYASYAVVDGAIKGTTAEEVPIRFSARSRSMVTLSLNLR